MKKNYARQVQKPIMKYFWLISMMLLTVISYGQNLRRPISQNQPMWLIHIDTWNFADPQKIIDLIPEDIRPYVVMNISLSISHDVSTSRFQTAEYGYEIAKSWLRTCAQNRMWVMVQPSSGGFTQFSDTDLSVYEEFYQDFPNFIGFNYAEQFWGYNDANDPLSADWSVRMSHFADLLELSNQYGGYLVVSWCGNQWSPNINPIAMMKRNAAFAQACSQYTENYILCEKYTQQGYQYDMESICLGAYLSGYSGQYGIRYDDTGWTDSSGTHANFTMATGLAPHLEHMMLTGETVIDGPELIWTQCFYETGTVQTSDGFTSRNWSTFSQFDNVNVDIFRKVLDGTVRIPSRQEVIDRTKVVIVNNVNSGTSNDIYSSPQTLFEGLYSMDGNYENNKTFFKKSGRYPTIPTVYLLDDTPANSFELKVNRSDYATRWPTVSNKVSEFNSLFPSEYTGDVYAGRYQNGWVIYNPYKTNQTANGNIPFKYNTCSSMDVAFSQYTTAVMKETSNQLKIYLNNYDNVLNTSLKTDIIKIYGSSSQPTYSFTERANHQASSLSGSWSGGVYTLTVQHNGALDITINCAGTATGRLTAYTTASLYAPMQPALYTGPRQYEAETFDRKSVGGVTTSGYSGSIRNYTGQGYLQFGTNAAASVRDVVAVPVAGTYKLETRYAVTGGNVTTVDLYVNGTKVATPNFTQTSSLSSWAVNSQNISLIAGNNTIEFRASAAAGNSLYFDNIVVSSNGSNEIWLEAECGNMGSLWSTLSSGTASSGSYIRIQDGNNSTAAAPTSTNGYVTYNFNITAAGTYNFWARTRAVSANDDSFWIKLDSNDWINWNGITASADWTWDDIQAYYLTAGSHTLTVAYREDGTDMDKIYIGNTTPTLNGNTAGNCSNTDNVWLEAECGSVGVLWDINSSSTASSGSYVRIKNGNNSNAGVPADSSGLITYPFTINTPGSYTLWARVRAASADDDSFWIRMDNGNWINWNGITASTDWLWDDVQSFTLSSGSHTLTVAYREDGTDMDKIYIGNSMPSSYGDGALNCQTLATTIQEQEAGFCSVDGAIESNYAGYTGTGFANTANAVGNGVSWSVNFTSSGTKTFNFRYASTGARPADLIVNGTTVVSNISFPSTGSWSTWSTVSVNASVSSGISTIRLQGTGTDGLGNIDYLEIVGANRSACVSSSSANTAKNTGTTDTDIQIKTPVIIATEYFNLLGQKLESIEFRSGFFVIIDIMSDGTIHTKKIWQP
jgi:Glycosyl hydrolase family 98/Glycosyl hydrolase family 98 C-terminal domain/Carbohydrate binding module (family 6)/Carbohydrate binding module (family 35)